MESEIVMERRTSERRESESERQKSLRSLKKAMIAAMLVAVVGVLVFAAHAGGRENLMVISLGILLSGASSLIGGTIGFLFGIPRTLQQDGAGRRAINLPRGSFPGRSVDYLINTNLEQISDWLTKILVGVSLTQINDIQEGLFTVSAFVAKGFSSEPHGHVFAYVLLLYSGVMGFLFGYLWTRLCMAGVLRLADQAAIGRLSERVNQASARIVNTETELNQLKERSELDSEALKLAHRQLNPSPGQEDIEQTVLDTAVAKASKTIKVHIFNQASQMRSENWREATTKAKMERAIPVFKALIHSDMERRYHMNHAQLGFALKDKRDPDWIGAFHELTTAMDIRDQRQKQGWVIYEFNRAVCRIMTDPEFLERRPSALDSKAEILQDLYAAAKSQRVRNIIDNDPVVKVWMPLNDLTVDNLH